jgi:hypothetical protein
MEIGLDLSPTVESKVGTIIENILGQLQVWGHAIKPREHALVVLSTRE